MGKLVLGIAAVLCLDIAFIAYLYSTKDPELQASARPASLRKPRPPKIAFPPPPNKPSKISEPEDTLASNVVRKVSASPRRSVARKSEMSKTAVATTRKHRNVQTELNKFPTKAESYYAKASRPRVSDVQVKKDEGGTVILYRGPRESADTSCASIDQPAKSSFRSRAVAVLKKPWSWIKTAGSKILR